MRFPHDDPEFGDLVRIAADARRISVAMVEKDYWVTHALWALEAQGFEVWFKGGTSLSKGFGLIERFSEDLDLKIEPGEVANVPAVTNWKSDKSGPVGHGVRTTRPSRAHGACRAHGLSFTRAIRASG